MAEIGAGYAPWIVSAYAALRNVRAAGTSKFRAVAVEADPTHCEWIRQHLKNNGIPADNVRVIEAAASEKDTPLYFPMIPNPAADWGAAAVADGNQTVDYRGFEMPLREVKGLPLQSILADYAHFDLVHIDIQGSEWPVIKAGLDCLSAKVDWLIVGTHSRWIEGNLFSLLSDNGWDLKNEKPCIFAARDGEKISERHIRIDGTQVWRNQRRL